MRFLYLSVRSNKIVGLQNFLLRSLECHAWKNELQRDKLYVVSKPASKINNIYPF